MAYLNENIAGTAMAASYQSNEMPAGNFQPNVLMANVCKHNVTKYPYDIARIAQDLAGGLMSTLPVRNNHHCKQLIDHHMLVSPAVQWLALQAMSSLHPTGISSGTNLSFCLWVCRCVCLCF